MLAFVLGGAVGAFVVLLAALLFFFTENRVSRNVLLALMWSPVGGALGALGWAAGPSLGVWIATTVGQQELLSSPGYADFYYYYSLFLLWQAGMGLTLGGLFSRESAEGPAGSAPAPVAGRNWVVRIARIALFAVAALVFAFLARTEFPQNYRSAEWQRAYKKHVAERPPMPNPPATTPSPENPPIQLPERPSLDNLPKIQSVAPERMLILHAFGKYVPGNVSPQPLPVAPASTHYLVRYAIPGANTAGKTGPVVWVQVDEYPNAAWALYESFQRANHPDFAGSIRTVRFGSQIYTRREAAEGQQSSYSWRSENRLVALSFWSADPDGILKAYLERFPSSEKRATGSSPNRNTEHPSLEDLREVQLQSPKQMLILHPFGEYVPSDERALKSVARLTPWAHNAFTPLNPNTPATQRYSVKYTVSEEPANRWQFNPTVEVGVEEYPNAAWAQYGIFQHAAGVDLANSPRPVKFGSRLYGQATDAAKGQNGSYMWASKNRLISISFSSAEPDEILKAYLERFPASEKASPEEIAKARAPRPEQQMLVLHQLGAYVPSRPSSGTTMQPPVAKYYSVRYALPGAPTMGKTGPTVDVEVYEYPNAAWAKYEIFERGGQTNFNPPRPVKFGNRIYGGAKAAATGQSGAYTNGQNGQYVWASGDRLIVMRFSSAEPDEVLKAYLEKFPTAAEDRP